MLYLIVTLLMNFSIYAEYGQGNHRSGTSARMELDAIQTGGQGALQGLQTIAGAQQAADTQAAASNIEAANKESAAAAKTAEAEKLRSDIQGGVCNGDKFSATSLNADHVAIAEVTATAKTTCNSSDIPASQSATSFAKKMNEQVNKCKVAFTAPQCDKLKECAKICPFANTCVDDTSSPNSPNMILTTCSPALTACLGAINAVPTKEKEVLASYNKKCVEAAALDKEAKVLLESAKKLKAGGISLLSVVTGLGQIGLGIGSAVLGMEVAKDQAALEEEMRRKAEAERCEIKCPSLYAQGTAEFRRCVCGVPNCSLQYSYNCDDTPCDEQYAEMDDAKLKKLMISVCTCKKGGLTYNETTKNCEMDPKQSQLAALTSAAPPTAALAKTCKSGEELIDGECKNKSAIEKLATTPASKNGSPVAGSPSQGISLSGDGASSKYNPAKNQYQNAIGGIGGAGFSNLDRDSKGSGGILGSNVNESQKIAKPKDIAVAQGVSIFDLVKQVHETGIQANRFLYLEKNSASNKTKSSVRKYKRS